MQVEPTEHPRNFTIKIWPPGLVSWELNTWCASQGLPKAVLDNLLCLYYHTNNDVSDCEYITDT
jgi:hypothetical protein